MIRRDIPIEELVDVFPGAVAYLMDKGVQCIACGAPIWGTLEEAARATGYTDEQIDQTVADLRELQEEARADESDGGA